MAEYSRIAQGSFTSTGLPQIVNLPFQPSKVRLTNYTKATTPAQNGVPFAYWQAEMGQGFAVIEAFNSAPALITDIVTSNGISTFSAGLLLQYGPLLQIASISTASAAVVTTASPHGYASGQVVIMQGLYQSTTTGMPQIAGVPFTITVTGTTTFTIPRNTNYTALSGSPTGAYVKQVLYPYLFVPGACYISALSLGTTTTVTTTSAHNFVVGQEVAFRVPSLWGTTQLNSLPNAVIPGSPIYGYVISVTSYNVFVVSINSSSYTAFNSNQAFNTAGLSYAQVVAVGDVNSGGVQISSGSPLYPPPYTVPISTTQVPAISFPGIQGGYFNNSSYGFIVGNGVGATLSSAVLVGASGNVIYYEAELSDLTQVDGY